MFKKIKNEKGEVVIENYVYKNNNYHDRFMSKKISEDFFESPPSDFIKGLNEIKLQFQKILAADTILTEPQEMERILTSNKDFNNINFKSLFERIFSSSFELSKKSFYINKSGELVNLIDYTIISTDNTGKLSVKFLPDFDLKREGYILPNVRNQRQRVPRGSSKNVNDPYDLNNVNLTPRNDSFINILNQYFDFLQENIPCVANKELLFEKFFTLFCKNNNIIREGGLEEIKENVSEIKKENINNVIFSKEDYLLEKDLPELSDINIINIIENTIISIIYNKKNKKSSSGVSTVFDPKHNSKVLNYDYFNEKKIESVILDNYSLEKMLKTSEDLKIYLNLNFYFDNIFHYTNKPEINMLDNDVNYYNDIEKIQKLTYQDFLKDFDLDDVKVNECVYYYLYEYVKYNMDINNYVSNILELFVNNNEKLNAIIKVSYLSISSINKYLSKPKEILSLWKDSTNNDCVQWLDEHFSSDYEKIFKYDLKSPLLKMEIFSNIEEKDLELYYNFLSTKKLNFQEIKLFVDCFMSRFGKHLDTPDKILAAFNVNNFEEEIKKSRNFDFLSLSSKDKLLTFKEKSLVLLKKIYYLFSSGSEEDIIELIDFLLQKKIFNTYSNIAFEYEGDNKIREPKTKIGQTLNSINKIISPIDYFLLFGKNKVVNFLKDKGFPLSSINNIKPDNSLENAILGCCDNNIIDWICDTLKVNKDTKLPIFNNIKPTSYVREINIFSKYENLFNYNADVLILNKMAYVYSKYKINYNFALSKLVLLEDKEEIKKIISNDLGLSNEIIKKIEYSKFIKKILENKDFTSFEEEVKSHRLKISDDFGDFIDVEIEVEDSKKYSSILSILNYFYIHYKYEIPKNIMTCLLSKYINILVEYTTQEDKDNMLNYINDNNYNVLEFLMEIDVVKNNLLIKKIVSETSIINFTNSKIKTYDMLNDDNIEKNYRSFFYDSKITGRIYESLITELEKEKVLNELPINNEIKVIKKRRM